MKTTGKKVIDNLNVVWTIASKDILDALRNKLIVSMILGLSFMLMMPKLMGLIIDPPYTQVLVFDPGNSLLVDAMEDSPLFEVLQVNSFSGLETAIGSTGLGLGAQFGVALPHDFDQILETGNVVSLDGFVVWSNRNKADQLKLDFEQQFSELIGKSVQINMEGNVIYPPTESTLLLSILTWTSVIVILTMGVNLVPHLLFEEKQTKTIQALLVSPASVGQVVLGKALAGLFYILVTAGVVFVINWAGVVHWGVAALFVLVSGLFCVALGLVLGSFFERPQEIAGLTLVLIVVFVGAMFINAMDLDIPSFVQMIVPLVPSVALSNILQFSYIESVSWAQLWPNLVSLLGFSILLYALVIWKVRQADR
jgi:ABC-2 type transport system permease protein